MSEAISILFPVLLYTSQGCCLQYFYGSFLKGRIRDKWTGGCGFICGAETGIVPGGRAGELGVQGSSLETGGGIVFFDGYCLLLL